MSILVTGATGHTGRRVVARLLRDGHAVRVLSRSADRARQVLGPDVHVHVGDVRDPESLRDLGVGLRGAIGATGTRTYFGSNGGAAVDALGTRNLIAAMAPHGVSHFVLLSAFGLDRRSVFLSAFSAVLGGYFKHKAAAERAVRASGLPYTIVRPVELRERPPRSPALLNQTAPLSLLRTVSRDLVAEVLVQCLGAPAAVGKTFEVCEGGAAPVTEQLVDLAADEARPKPVNTPLW